MRGEMFTRGSKGNSPTSGNLPLPQPQKRVGRSAPSIISDDLVVVGTLTSTGDIQIDGKVEGDIRSGSVTIGEKANFEGEIVAEECTIRGRVQGIVRARKVQLSSTCHMEGTILHEVLAVEVGAFFEGSCRHSSDPLSETAGKPESRASFEPKRDLAPAAAASPAPQPAATTPATTSFPRSVTPSTTRTTSNGSLLGAIKARQ
jgi:cytoskeletal protein CcmA (bactofilin family)